MYYAMNGSADLRAAIEAGDIETLSAMFTAGTLTMLSEPQQDVVTDWAALAPEVLHDCFRYLNPLALSRAGLTCRSWRLVANSNALWRRHVELWWPEASGLSNVHSYKRLVAELLPPKPCEEPLQFMTRIDLGHRGQDGRVLACTLAETDVKDGVWRLPPLDISDDDVVFLASRHYQNDGGLGEGTLRLGELSLSLTVTAVRPSDGTVFRMLHNASAGLPPSPGFDFYIEDEAVEDLQFFCEPLDHPRMSAVLVAVLRTAEEEYEVVTDGSPSEEAIRAFREGFTLELGWRWPPPKEEAAEEAEDSYLSRFLRRIKLGERLNDESDLSLPDVLRELWSVGNLREDVFVDRRYLTGELRVLPCHDPAYA